MNVNDLFTFIHSHLFQLDIISCQLCQLRLVCEDPELQQRKPLFYGFFVGGFFLLILIDEN